MINLLRNLFAPKPRIFETDLVELPFIGENSRRSGMVLSREVIASVSQIELHQSDYGDDKGMYYCTASWHKGNGSREYGVISQLARFQPLQRVKPFCEKSISSSMIRLAASLSISQSAPTITSLRSSFRFIFRRCLLRLLNHCPALAYKEFLKMWNEKALKQINRQRATRSIDALDEEAERQGNATQYFAKNEIRPKILGRRISKETRKADGFAKTADRKATANLVKDTAEVAKRIMVPQTVLRQSGYQMHSNW